VTGLLTNPTRVFGLIGIASATGVGAALVSQHVFDMQPCPWCILQRLIFMLIACVAVVGLFWRGRGAQLGAAVLIDLLATCGISAALWQHFVAAVSQSCKLTLADKIISGLALDGALPEIFAVRASCAEAVASMFGVPYEFWSLALFAVVGALSVLALLGRLKRR
jgi:protein dithiol:quinone oxidoreductase